MRGDYTIIIDDWTVCVDFTSEGKPGGTRTEHVFCGRAIILLDKAEVCGGCGVPTPQDVRITRSLIRKGLGLRFS